MAWRGYWEYDSSEVINGPRTEAYLVNAGKQWFIETFAKHDFHAMLGQPDYVSPLVDGAPWVDPDLPASWEFYGFYPLDVAGAEDSARSSSVQEYTVDGGSPGRVRHGTKSIVFNGLLMAESERGAEYGMRWLRRALLGARCEDVSGIISGLGADLTFFAAEPFVDTYDNEEVVLSGGNAVSGAHLLTDPDLFDITTVPGLRADLRTFKRVSITNGPSKLTSRKMSCGGQVWNVQFTATVGNPWEYGVTRQIIQGFMDPGTPNPWVPGVTPGSASTAPTSFTDVDCGSDLWTPIYDPLCPAVITPPAPPSVPLGCSDLPATWNRWKVSVPGDNVPLWGDVVPVITVAAGTEDIRNVRLRFYADPTGTFSTDATPCDYVGDIVISYIPALGSALIDGVSEEVSILTSLGHRRAAGSLVHTTDNKPITWPSLSCGYGYIMTVDLDPAYDTPVVDFALAARSR